MSLPPQLIGNTAKAIRFLEENKRATVDEVAIHLDIPVDHARDVLFRARERGFVRKIPITYVLTPTGRKAYLANTEPDPGSPEAELTQEQQ